MLIDDGSQLGGDGFQSRRHRYPLEARFACVVIEAQGGRAPALRVSQAPAGPDGLANRASLGAEAG